MDSTVSISSRLRYYSDDDELLYKQVIVEADDDDVIGVKVKTYVNHGVWIWFPEVAGILKGYASLSLKPEIL